MPDNAGFEGEDIGMRDLGDFSGYTDEWIDEELGDMNSQLGMLEGSERGRIVERIDRLEQERNNRIRRNEGVTETSFPDSNDGTVSIRGTNTHVPAVDFAEPSPSNPENRNWVAFEKFASKDIGRRFRLSIDDKIKVRLRTSMSGGNSLEFKPKGVNNGLIKKQIVLKRVKGGDLEYNDKVKSPAILEAVEQFKVFTRSIIESSVAERGETLMINTEASHKRVLGLSPKENQGHISLLDESIDESIESRIGDNGTLQTQANRYDKLVDDLENRVIELVSKDDEEGITESEKKEYNELIERIDGLKQAREETIEQRELEETRELQEEDVDRYERFKRWAKENIIGLSAIAISIAGIVTAITVGARGAIVSGARGVKSFAQAIKDAIAKLGPWAAGLANLAYNIIVASAKALGWLARNLWVVFVVIAWFVFEWYNKKR